jgi:NAD(P) transhydrogenase subunit alpha
MHIAIPVERSAGETRVAATPETVRKLVAQGHAVAVENGAGARAGIADADWIAAGARVAPDRRAALAGADIVFKVRAPAADELDDYPAGAAVIGLMQPHDNTLLPAMAARGLSVYALELLPRTTRAQSMDVLSSQNNVAGYRAVLTAAQYYPRFMPLMMTAAGTVKPARVLILGAGVAGLQAVATAKRLGAVVEVFDVRAATREQVESLGAKFVEVEMSEEEKAGSQGVYAQEMSADYLRRQGELIARHAAAADIVISTALIPGRPAPRLLPAAAVEAMRAGSVVVDLAAASGGNCELTRPGSVWVTPGGVTVVGDDNLPGRLAADASSLYARNLLAFAALLLTPAAPDAAPDPLLTATLIAGGGELRWPRADAHQEKA